MPDSQTRGVYKPSRWEIAQLHKHTGNGPGTTVYPLRDDLVQRGDPVILVWATTTWVTTPVNFQETPHSRGASNGYNGYALTTYDPDSPPGYTPSGGWLGGAWMMVAFHHPTIQGGVTVGTYNWAPSSIPAIWVPAGGAQIQFCGQLQSVSANARAGGEDAFEYINDGTYGAIGFMFKRFTQPYETGLNMTGGAGGQYTWSSWGFLPGE